MRAIGEEDGRPPAARSGGARRSASRAALLVAVLLVTTTNAAASHVAGQPLGPDGVPAGASWSEHYVRSFDGTLLHVDLLRPEALPAGARTPVILSMGPYNGHSAPADGMSLTRRGPVGSSLLTRARPWERGYAVAYVDMRGFGASEGCVDFGGERDRRDALRLLRWAATRDWSTGRVVMAGRSYSGIPVLAALRRPPRALAGAVLIAPSAAWYAARYMNGVHYEGITHTISLGYNGGYGSAPGSVYDEPRYHEGWAHGLRPDCWDDHHAEQLKPDRGDAYWRERELVPAGRGRTVPVLAAQGFRDQAVHMDQLDLWWGRLSGWRSLWIGQFDHDSPLDAGIVGRDGFLAQLNRFLDATLAAAPLPDDDRGVVVQEAPTGRWRREPAWPPDDRAEATMTLLAGRYRDEPGNRGERWETTQPSAGTPYQAGSLSPFTGRGTWTFSAPLGSELHLAGAPSLSARLIAPAGANLIALLYDVAPDGKALLMSRGAATVPQGGELRFELYGQDWRVPAGHRLGLLITGADELWWAPLTRTLAEVEVLGGKLTLPRLTGPRRDFVDGDAGSRLRRHGPIEVDPALCERRTGGLTR